MKVDSKIGNTASQAQSLNSSKSTEAKKKDVSKDLSNLGAPSPKANPKNNAAQVELSNLAQELKKAKEIASKAPDVDTDKVKKFQALIDSGNYKVKADKVADKLVEDHLMNAAMTEEK